MKIAVLSYGFPTQEYPTNGIFQWDGAKALASLGHDVAFLAVDLRSIRKKRAYGVRRFTKDGVEVFVYSLPIGPMRAVNNIFAKHGFSCLLKKLIRECFRPDIVHAHFGDSAYSASEFCRTHRLPFVITEHSSGMHGDKIDPSYLRRVRTAYETSDAVCAVSSSLCRSIEHATGILPMCVPNIVDTDIFYKNKTSKCSKRLVSVGNLKYGKGFDCLIRAFAALRAEIPCATLTIIGEGPERKALTDLCEKLGCYDSVEFKGELTRDEIADEFAKSDVFVLASRKETFGVSYIEAMAAGLFVVGTLCGGPEDFVDDRCGILVPVDDADALTSAMVCALKNSDDHNTSMISERARTLFSPKRIASRMTEIFGSVLSVHTSGGKIKARPENAPHGYLYRFLVLLLVVSSGFGGVVMPFGIKLSYVAAAAVFVCFCVDKIRNFRVPSNKYYLAFMLFSVIWALYALVGGVFAKDSSLWFSYFRALAVNLFIVIILIDYARELEDIRFILYGFAFYITACLIVGYFEIFADLHLVDIRETSRYLPHSFYGNENDNAAVLFYGLVAYLLCVTLPGKTVYKIGFFLCIPSVVYQIIQTRSRAAIYGMAVLLVSVVFFACLCAVHRKSKRVYRITAFSAVFMALGALIYIFTAYSLSEIVSFISSEGNLESDNLRTELIMAGFDSLRQTYGLGVGCGQSILLGGTNLHNFYLEVFSEYGVLIGAAFCTFMLGMAFGYDKNRLNIPTCALVRSFPMVMILVGVGPSSALKLRATWIIISVILSLKYIKLGGTYEH